jgi:hypothetical protein
MRQSAPSHAIKITRDMRLSASHQRIWTAGVYRRKGSFQLARLWGVSLLHHELCTPSTSWISKNTGTPEKTGSDHISDEPVFVQNRRVGNPKSMVPTPSRREVIFTNGICRMSVERNLSRKSRVLHATISQGEVRPALDPAVRHEPSDCQPEADDREGMPRSVAVNETVSALPHPATEGSRARSVAPPPV